MKTLYYIKNQLDKEDTCCCCLNENSCILKYCILPIGKYIFKPIYKYLLKPIGRFFKQIFMSFDNCSISVFAIQTD